MTDNDQIAGMTVNERLLHFGLFEAFDSAVATREILAVVAVLQRAKLTDQEAHETASAILANPSYYGLR